MDPNALRKRYQYLWTGEACAAALFLALFLWVTYQDGRWQHWVVRTYSLGVVLLILLQGVAWWRWKIHLLDTQQRQMPAPVIRVYRAWRWINWLLIGGFPLVVVSTTWLTQQPLLAPDTWLGLLMLGGAVLEQINYYHVQLMYDSAYDWTHLRAHRRLRRGTIAKALDASLVR